MSGTSTPSRKLSSTTTRVAAPESTEGFLVQLGPDARTGTEGQKACRLAAAAERHHEQSGASIFSALRIADHRARAVIDLGSSPGAVTNHRARLQGLVSAQLAHEALDGLIAAANPFSDTRSCQIAMALRPRLRPSSIASRNGSQKLVDGMGLGFSASEALPLHAKPGGHLVGRFCGCFCFSLIRKVFGVGVGVGVDRGQFGRVRPGGHLVGRFCRRSPSPRTWRPHSDPGRLQIGYRRFLDAPRSLARCAAAAIPAVPGQ